MPDNPRVFCSYRSIDKVRVQAIAEQLTAAGIDPWWDGWEINPGDNIVARINEGLRTCDAGLIFFSRHTLDSNWVQHEISTLICQEIENGKPLLLVMLDPDAPLPPLLLPVKRLDATQIDPLIDAIYHTIAGGSQKPPLAPPRATRRERVFQIALQDAGSDALRVSAALDGEAIGEAQHVRLSSDFRFSYHDFLRHTLPGSRMRAEDVVRQRQRDLARLGQAIGQALFPDPIGARLATVLGEARAAGTGLLLAFETPEARLLAMPFEAARLPDGRAPALEPGVRILRRHPDARVAPVALLAGPLRLLIAVGAPDEGQTTNVALDHERELQTILDGIDQARHRGHAEVNILEVAHPSQIQRALLERSYHVLHISGHGQAGMIEMEDEDGRAVPMTAADLANAIRQSGKQVPLLFLASCLSGVSGSDTVGLAQELLQHGVPLVLAMQSSVSDWYATRLAGAFYEQLSRMQVPLASHALAVARQEVETARRQAVDRGELSGQYQAEYATPSLFCAGTEHPLLDRTLPQEAPQPLPPPPLVANMPLLSMDALIGRRAVLRRVMQVLRDHSQAVAVHGRKAGGLLWGMGGVGKSALAGRIMARLLEDGWTTVAVVGRWSLGELASRVGSQLLGHRDAALDRLGDLLLRHDLPDEVRLVKLQELLAGHRVLLVLDNFEDNLVVGGGDFLDPTTESVLLTLMRTAQRGKLLVTSRYPMPRGGEWLVQEPLGPLSLAETRKLFYRLPSLANAAPETLGLVLRHIGGHPRLLEYLDALLRQGTARLPEVTRRLHAQARALGLASEQLGGDLTQSIRDVLWLGAEDILLEQLLDIIRATPDALETLFQASVFALPVPTQGLASALAGSQEPTPAQVAATQRTVQPLIDSSLLTPLDQGRVWVHRWTAQHLKTRMGDATFRACCHRAGEYLLVSRTLADAVEAVRCFLEAQALDRATDVAMAILHFMERYGQLADVAAFTAEVLAALPLAHTHYASLCVVEADALMRLGATRKAFERYQEAMTIRESRVAAEPDRANYQRDLSVSYERMGDLLQALGQGEAARQYYQQDLEIARRLVTAEPDRADYQHDLSVSYERMGDLLRSLGQGEAARQYQQALEMRQRLVTAEPDRADYQRDLSVFYNKMGDLLRSLGQGEAARQYYQQALEMRQRLVTAEPDRADYQRDLSVSYNKMGDLLQTLGQGEAAQQYYQQALEIAQQLVTAEPDRADYQRGLSVSYNKMGDLLQTLGQGEAAQQYYQQDLEIAQQLVTAEPDRADYQRDLSVSYNKMGDLLQTLGQGEAARQYYQQALEMRQRLVTAEPDRADYQRDLSVSYNKMGDLLRSLGQGEAARQYYQQDLEIAQRLVTAEPDRADYQWDLVVSLVRMADVEPGNSTEHHTRALDILRDLQATDRLFPEQERLMRELEQALRTED